MEELVKISDAAANWVSTIRHFRRSVRDGRGPRCVLTPGNRMCFRESDLRDWTNGLGTYEPVTAGPCNHPRKNPLSR